MLSAVDIKQKKLATFRTRKLMEYKGNQDCVTRTGEDACS
jgi:hypothetical protein